MDYLQPFPTRSFDDQLTEDSNSKAYFDMIKFIKQTWQFANIHLGDTDILSSCKNNLHGMKSISSPLPILFKLVKHVFTKLVDKIETISDQNLSLMKQIEASDVQIRDLRVSISRLAKESKSSKKQNSKFKNDSFLSRLTDFPTNHVKSQVRFDTNTYK